MPAGLAVPSGFHISLYARGFHQPTALALGPDGKLYITQLNGPESAGSGQILVVRALGHATVLMRRLYKPTGLVWRGRDLYIAAGRNLLSAVLNGNGHLVHVNTVLHNLPFNDRSEGQIDLLPDGRLLFEVSGGIRTPRSGRLLTLFPGGGPRVLATGLKNPYAHAVDPVRGRIFTTDIEQDTVNGKAPPDEINLVRSGADYGWPRCYGYRQPAYNRGGNAEVCAHTTSALVTLPPHSTPTGLVYYSRSDFPAGYRDVLYVALWDGDPPRVVRVSLHGSGNQVTGTVSRFISGLRRPIALLPDRRSGLLVLDYGSGRLYRVTR